MTTIDAHVGGATRLRDAVRRAADTDLWHSFKRRKLTIVSAVVTAIIVFSAIAAPWVAPSNPYDMANVSLSDAFVPPVWAKRGQATFLLGTDNQGRDLLSAIIYGLRTSVVVGIAAIGLAMVVGVTLGLIAGYYGGFLGVAIMRVADVQLSFPAILSAMILDGIARSFLPREMHHELAFYVIVLAVGLSQWVQFARTVRGSTLVEKHKEYVLAAQLVARSRFSILVQHILPNVLSPVLVLATIGLGVAILTEATLSFLGLGMPPTQPSLGTLINTGMNFVFSGEWWIAIFPGVVLAVLVLGINLLGDWLRDALNPRLR